MPIQTKRRWYISGEKDGGLGGGGKGTLTDGSRAGPDYLDPAWQGFWQDDLVATIEVYPQTEICR